MEKVNVCQAVYEEMRLKYGVSDAVRILQPEDILQVELISDVSGDIQENFVVLTLNGASEVINSYVITRGLLNHSLVHPREVFRTAIMDSAAAIICVHNHPSGGLEPSSQDIQVTKQLKEAGDIIGISVLDHVIVSKNGIKSLRSLGYL